MGTSRNTSSSSNRPTLALSSTLEELDEALRILLELLGLYHRMEQSLGVPPPESVAGLLEQVQALRKKKRLDDRVQFVQPLLKGCEPALRCFRLQLQKLFLLLVLITQDSAPRGEIRVTSAHEGKGIVVRMTNLAFRLPEQLWSDLPFPTASRPADASNSLRMSICRVIIDRHHGHLSVEGEPGRGITFIVRLPLDRKPSQST